MRLYLPHRHKLLKVGTDIGNSLWVEGIRRLVTITEATDYAEGIRRTAVAQFEKLGGSIVAAESYSSEVIDFRSPLTKMMGENPDALFISAQAETSGGTIVKQARELGYVGPIYSDVVTTGPGALSISGDAATGMKAVVPNPNLTTSAGKDLIANYKAKIRCSGSMALVPGIRLRWGLYCRRMPETDQRRPGY